MYSALYSILCSMINVFNIVHILKLLCTCNCLPVSFSACLPVSLSARLPVIVLSVYLPVWLSACQLVSLSVFSPVSVSACLACLPVSLSTYQLVYLSTYLSFSSEYPILFIPINFLMPLFTNCHCFIYSHLFDSCWQNKYNLSYFFNKSWIIYLFPFILF